MEEGERARGEVGMIVLEALRGDVVATRQSGPDVIVALIAIRGLRGREEAAGGGGILGSDGVS